MFGLPSVSNSCVFFTAHEAAGARSIRHSLRPLMEEGHEPDTTRANHAAGTLRHIFSSLRGAKRRSNPDHFRGVHSGLLRSARNDDWRELCAYTGLPAYGIDAVRPPSTGNAWPLT